MKQRLAVFLAAVILVALIIPVWGNKTEPYYDYKKGEIIIKFRQSERKADIKRFLDSRNYKIKEKSPYVDAYLISIPEEKSEVMEIPELRSLPNIEFAEYNYICKKNFTPNDPNYTSQHGMRQISMPQAWDITTGDPGVVIAVIDTGIDLDHTDLLANVYSSGYNAVADNYNGDDDEGHGTHVAGIIAAVTNNSVGVSGIAFNCQLLPVKVLDSSGSGTSYDLAEGINYAVNQGAEVINMSLGWPVDQGVAYEPGSVVSNAIRNAYVNDVIMIASSGNDGEPAVGYPAAYDEVISVGAVDRYDSKTSYSNWGPKLDVVAPGGDAPPTEDLILSTYYLNQLAWMGGTSQASPHVAGVAALMYTRGAVEPESVRFILQVSSIDLGNSGRDDMYGYGRIDAYRAIQASQPDQVYNLTQAYNYPNPFEKKTNIIFTVTQDQTVQVNVYDSNLNSVESFQINAKAGQNNNFLWNAEGHGNNVYFIKLEGPDGTRVIKAVKAE